MPNSCYRRDDRPRRGSCLSARSLLRCETLPVLLALCSTLQGSPSSPDAPQVSIVGVIAKTHAVRKVIPGGFHNSLEFKFVRFLETEREDVPLSVQYVFEWISARPEDFGKGTELRQPQEIGFPVPHATDRNRGYQTSTVVLTLPDQHRGEVVQRVLCGQQLRVSVVVPSDRRYRVVDEEGRLIPEMNRRWAEASALCRIYNGCVISCLPNDQVSATEVNPIDVGDLDQFVPDCYFIAALAGAVQRDPEHVRSLIRQTPDGFLVHFPGHDPIAVPRDLDRGPDMVESQALDVDSHGNVEIWPVLLERAFAVWNSRSNAGRSERGQEFQDIPNGDSQHAYFVLTGRRVKEAARWEFASRSSLLQAINRHLAMARPVMMSTGKWTHAGDRPHWWLEHHVYLFSAVAPNQKTFTVYDPRSGRWIERIKVGDWFDAPDVKRFLFCD